MVTIREHHKPATKQVLWSSVTSFGSFLLWTVIAPCILHMAGGSTIPSSAWTSKLAAIFPGRNLFYFLNEQMGAALVPVLSRVYHKMRPLGEVWAWIAKLLSMFTSHANDKWNVIPSTWQKACWSTACLDAGTIVPSSIKLVLRIHVSRSSANTLATMKLLLWIRVLNALQPIGTSHWCILLDTLSTSAFSLSGQFGTSKLKQKVWRLVSIHTDSQNKLEENWSYKKQNTKQRLEKVWSSFL